MARIRLCSVQQAPPPGKGAHFDAGDGPGVALFNVEGELLAIEDNCPHMDSPIHDGVCVRGVVTCMWHGWQFDLRTGESLMSDRIRVTKYAVIIKDDEVFVEMPEE